MVSTDRETASMETTIGDPQGAPIFPDEIGRRIDLESRLCKAKVNVIITDINMSS